MSQATVQELPHLWAEFESATQNYLDFNMDLARANFNTNNKEGFENILTARESVLDNIGDDFLIECLSGFSNEDIAGCLEDFENEYACLHSANSSMMDLSATLTSSCASLPGNTVERTVSTVEKSLHDGKDMVPFPCNNKSEMDWFPPLNEDPVIFVGTRFEADPFLIRQDHKSNGASRIVCQGTSQKLFSSAEVSLKHETSTVSNYAASFTVENSVPAHAKRNRPRSRIRVSSAGMITNRYTPTNSILSPTQQSNIATFCQPDIRSTPYNKASESMHHTLPDRQATCNPVCSKKAWKLTNSKKSEETGQPRRCAHCLTQKTPQWRMGPTGPKTLCNACGVRYKSGRLFPEYRPARSPTFTSCKHSNSHKKVMEMRSCKTMALDLCVKQRKKGI